MVKNLPANVGDTGSIPYAAEQLSPCAAAIEPVFQSQGNTTAELVCLRVYAWQQERPPH